MQETLNEITFTNIIVYCFPNVQRLQQNNKYYKEEYSQN